MILEVGRLILFSLEVAIDGNDIAIEPIARDGERQYGGDDVTQAIVDFVLTGIWTAN